VADDVPVARVRVYLVGGEVVEGDQRDATDDEIKGMKDALAEILASSGDWQVSVERGDSWYVFPKQSVLYVEIEVRRG